MRDVIPHAPDSAPRNLGIVSFELIRQMPRQLSDLKDAHGDRVLICGALEKSLAGISEIVVRDVNLITVAEDVFNDVRIAINRGHRSEPPHL